MSDAPRNASAQASAGGDLQAIVRVGFIVVVLAFVTAFLAAQHLGAPDRPRPMAEASSQVAEVLSSVDLNSEELQLAAELAAVPASDTPKNQINNVSLTFYDCAGQGFCGRMFNGRKVHEGAAACSWNLAAGTKFVIPGDPTGRVYVCEDRGLLPNTSVDIFFYQPADGYQWQGMVGRYGPIVLVN